LRSRIGGVALDVLTASRAGELKFSHKFYWPSNAPVSDTTRGPSVYWTFIEKLQARRFSRRHFKFAGFSGFKSFG
jgi:hypothetical protein